jgi:hypothetical protein
MSLLIFEEFSVLPPILLLDLTVETDIMLASLTFGKYVVPAPRFEWTLDVNQKRTPVQQTSRENNNPALSPVKPTKTTMIAASVNTRKNYFHPSLATANNELFPTLYRRDQ